jgi:C4-dicarboxylate-binding protein DctP
MRLDRPMILAFILYLLNPGASSAEEVRLRVNLQQSIADLAGRNINDFKRRVETHTKGATTIQISEKGESDPGRSAPRMAAGTFEIDAVSLAELAEEVPAAGLFTQPFLFNFDSMVHAAARPGSEVRSIIDGEIAKSGSRVLWWQPSGSMVIVSKGTPITSPQSLRDHKIGVSDNQAAEFISLCGGVPKQIAPGRETEVMETKTIDSAILSTASIGANKIWKSADIINNIRYYKNMIVVLVSEKSWRNLSDEQKKIIADAASTVESNIWEHFTQVEAEDYDYALQKGMRIAVLTGDDTLAWRACSSSILESYLGRTESIGARLLAAYRKLRDDPCCNEFIPSPTGD